MHFGIISGQHWMINAWIMGILIKNASKENMKLLASKFNEKKFFLRSQLYARAYVRIWTLRPWAWSIFLCHSHCFETYGAVFIMNSKIHLRKNSSNEYFNTISHYLRVYSLSGFTVGRSINGLVFFFAAFAEVQVTVLSVLNLPRQGLPATCPVGHCCACNPRFAICQRTINRGWIKWAQVSTCVAWKPKMYDDVMLHGVFRICLWLVARQLRIPNR